MINVMIVDDEAGFASTLAERLEMRKLNVSVAETGAQAITMLPEEKPDVVLLDLSLPDMSGLKVLKQIKEQSAQTEVIILTGRLACEVDGKQDAAFCCLSKPVKINELLSVITEAYGVSH